MELNFNPEKLSNSKDKFIWITIKYILDILKLLKKNINNLILVDILKMNCKVLKKNIDNYDNLLDTIIELNIINEKIIETFTNIFIEMIKTIPINVNDDEFLC